MGKESIVGVGEVYHVAWLTAQSGWLHDTLFSRRIRHQTNSVLIDTHLEIHSYEATI